MKMALRPTLLALLLIAAVPAFAQQGPEGTAPGAPSAAEPVSGAEWSSLTADQQKLLERFRDRWSTLSPERQQALARGSKRWLSMSPEQRSGAKERFQRWRDLPPEQRSR